MSFIFLPVENRDTVFYSTEALVSFIGYSADHTGLLELKVP